MHRHTGGDWYVVHQGSFQQAVCVDTEAGRVEIATTHAQAEYVGGLPAEANARRIADCVNALEGCEPAELGNAIATLEALADGPFVGENVRVVARRALLALRLPGRRAETVVDK